MPIRRQPAEEIAINLTPMIDVVFLLVIFFMVGSKFNESESRIQVNVPGVAEMRSMARVPDERVVEIAPDGSITLDGSFVTQEQLVSTLKTQHAAYPALKVAVRGDGGSSFQGVVDVMQAIRASGVDQIGIAARRNYR